MSMPTLRVQLAGISGGGAIAILALTSVMVRGTGLSPKLGVTAATAFVVVMSVAVTGISRFHPFPRLGPANLVTTLRTALVALLIALSLEAPDPAVAWTMVVVASVAAILDGWDGWLARRTGMGSPFGARFDMEIDALLILVLGACAWRHGKAGSWVLLSGALRYLFVVAGLVLPWLNAPLPPSLRRKAVCVIQIVTLIVAIGPVIPSPASDTIAGASLILLCWSFAVDVWWLWGVRAATTARA